MPTLWPPELRHRAPPEFPPRWASAWGDDAHGLWADWVLRTPHGEASQRLRWIEPSQGQGFWMGSTQAERDQINNKDVRRWANEHECKPMQVRIAQGFWLADTPVTQALWQVATGHNPSHFAHGPDAALRPVEDVPLAADLGSKKGRANTDVLDFLQALQAQLPAGHVATLPTEMEWEYACRADTRSAYPWGDAFDPGRANTDHRGDKSFGDKQGTSPVKTYPPNPWGLYDMQGNVWEWTATPWQEKWSPEHAQAQAQNQAAFGQWATRVQAAKQPSGQANAGKALNKATEAVFAVRGGSWIDRPGYARSACRDGRRAGSRPHDWGLRFALRSSSTSPAPGAGLGPEGQG